LARLEELPKSGASSGHGNQMAPFEFGVVLPQQIKVHTTLAVQVSNGDVVAPRRRIGYEHETLGSPKQKVNLATTDLQPH
jgi:hypothetical protein